MVQARHLLGFFAPANLPAEAAHLTDLACGAAFNEWSLVIQFQRSCMALEAISNRLTDLEQQVHQSMDPVQINNLQAAFEREQHAHGRQYERWHAISKELDVSRSMTNLHCSNRHHFFAAMFKGKLNPHQIHANLGGKVNPSQIRHANPLVVNPEIITYPLASGQGRPRYTNVVVSQRTGGKASSWWTRRCHPSFLFAPLPS